MQQDVFIGKQVDHYLLQERINQSGAMYVYRAFDLEGRRDVALRLVRVSVSPSTNARQAQHAFDDEAERLQAIVHPNVLPIYDYGIVDGFAFVVMPLAKGGNLAAALELTPDPPLEQIERWMQQLASALKKLHQQKIIHQDLKPQNVLLDDAGNAFLADLGLLERLSGSNILTTRERTESAVSFKAPEELQGEAATPLSDQYSLGVLLFLMLTQRLPFSTEGDLVTMMERHLNEWPPSPQEFNPNINKPLSDVVLKMLAKAPQARYPDLDAFLDALDAALHRGGQTLSTSDLTRPIIAAPPTVPPSMSNHRIRGIFIVALVLSVIGIGAGIGYGFNPQNRIEGEVLNGQTEIANNLFISQQMVDLATRRLGDNRDLIYIQCDGRRDSEIGLALALGALVDRYNLSLTLYDSANDPAQQEANLATAYGAGNSLIMLCALASPDTLNSLDRIVADRVSLVMNTTDFAGQLENTVFVQTDHYQNGFIAGVAAGEYAREQGLERPTVLLLNPSDTAASLARRDGMLDGFSSVLPQARLPIEYPAATEAEAAASVGSLLINALRYDLILAVDAVSVRGAITALAAADIPPAQAAIFAAELDGRLLQDIERGYYVRSGVIAPREAEAEAMFNAAIRIIAGQSVSETVMLPVGTVYKTP
ncbi:MAG: protein kinase domain-containing protein [Phototrophicaceae bacterium]|jgi:serine/threonine protein kinase/ABC-type sugar transport system substrate-binding protein